MKPCKTCHTDKKLNDYYDGTGKFGKMGDCIDCYKFKVNARHKKNRNASAKD